MKHFIFLFALLALCIFVVTVVLPPDTANGNQVAWSIAQMFVK